MKQSLMNRSWLYCFSILLFIGVNGEFDEQAAANYLAQYGYISPGKLSSGHSGDGYADEPQNFMRDAIEKFQDFAGLEKTGILDETTKNQMIMPRCGIPDVQAMVGGDNLALKWSRSSLTYSIENYSPDLPHEDVRNAIRDSYNVWSQVTSLEFREVPAGQGDIKVRFGSRNHGDPWPFDGPGHVLAHGSFPENGALHFDEDENWSFRDANRLKSGSMDVFAVGIHEAGHTLGLEHSKDKTSIMAPFIISTLDSNGNYLAPRLKQGDIDAIQALYDKLTA